MLGEALSPSAFGTEISIALIKPLRGIQRWPQISIIIPCLGLNEELLRMKSSAPIGSWSSVTIPIEIPAMRRQLINLGRSWMPILFCRTRRSGRITTRLLHQGKPIDEQGIINRAAKGENLARILRGVLASARVSRKRPKQNPSVLPAPSWGASILCRARAVQRPHAANSLLRRRSTLFSVTAAVTSTV